MCASMEKYQNVSKRIKYVCKFHFELLFCATYFRNNNGITHLYKNTK